jgi:RHH-type rel operon transcriptional repressor/antitoxin RelB
MRTLSVRLEDEIDDRLKRLSTETNRSKSFYVKEALLKSLDDMEDVYLADQVIERIRKGQEKTSTLDEVEARLGLED